MSSSSQRNQQPWLEHNPRQNRLLAALSKAEIDRLTARMQLVQLHLGDSIYEPNQPLIYAYFLRRALFHCIM